MAVLEKLKLSAFRCLQSQQLALAPGMSWIHGDNAAGKTSLLEGIYFLGRGRSLRGASPAECLQHGAEGWLLEARLVAAPRPAERLQLRYLGGQLQARRNDNAVGLATAARALPVQCIEAGLHRLVEDGPVYRRRFLDWGLFHVEPAYLAAWQRYARALRQRNALLRQGGGGADRLAWDRELAAAGEALHALRARGMASLQPVFAQLCEELGLPASEILLLPGWSAERRFTEDLAQRLEGDRRLGHTSQGPHRAELRLRVGGHKARAEVSRGQQKLLVAALCLAQARLLAEAQGRYPLLLVDDFGAELGAVYQQRLLAALDDYRGQCVVTALAPPPQLPSDGALFHVEQGRVHRSG